MSAFHNSTHRHHLRYNIYLPVCMCTQHLPTSSLEGGTQEFLFIIGVVFVARETELFKNGLFQTYTCYGILVSCVYILITLYYMCVSSVKVHEQYSHQFIYSNLILCVCVWVWVACWLLNYKILLKICH